MKKIISLIICFTFILGVSTQHLMAQESVALEKNDVMVSLNLGVGSYIQGDFQMPGKANYNLMVPMSGWFDKGLMLDLEGRWMMTDKWAVKLSGGFNFSHNPGYAELPGTTMPDEEFELGDVPGYGAVPSSESIQYAVALGFERYFTTGVDNLFLRAGFEFGGAYGRSSAAADDEIYSGQTVGEAYSLRAAPVVGVDYFFNEAVFVGLDVRPLSYQYSVYGVRPEAGLSMLRSDNHSVTFISNPVLKIGFKF